MNTKVKFNKTDIPQISQKVLKKVLKKNNTKATVIALSGELGAGKTTLTHELGRLLGIKNSIISPTFVIMKIYDMNKNSIYYSNFKKLIHIDAYRLEKSSELIHLGWEEIISNKENLVIIEWPERISEIIPNHSIDILISHVNENQRQIKF